MASCKVAFFPWRFLDSFLGGFDDDQLIDWYDVIAAKSGVEPSNCVELAKHVKLGCPSLKFSGLMTIGMPDYTSTPENFRVIILHISGQHANSCYLITHSIWNEMDFVSLKIDMNLFAFLDTKILRSSFTIMGFRQLSSFIFLYCLSVDVGTASMIPFSRNQYQIITFPWFVI